VAAAIRAYEKTRENLPTAHTRTAIWRRLEAHLGRHMASELDNTLVQRDFIKPRLKDAHPGTVRKEACFLLAVLRLAHDNGHLDRVPKFQLPPVSPPRERWLTPAELDRLEAAAPDFRTRLFIAIARYTGARMAAIQELTWARVDLEQKVIDFGAGLGKKRRARGDRPRLRPPRLPGRGCAGRAGGGVSARIAPLPGLQRRPARRGTALGRPGAGEHRRSGRKDVCEIPAGGVVGRCRKRAKSEREPGI
jgi:integrase